MSRLAHSVDMTHQLVLFPLCFQEIEFTNEALIYMKFVQ